MTDSLEARVLYRLAFGAAYRLIEPLRGSDRPRSIDGAAVLAEVVRQLGDAPEVRQGVADAVEGRKPAW